MMPPRSRPYLAPLALLLAGPLAGRSIGAGLHAVSPGLAPTSIRASVPAQDEAAELEALLADERAQADLDRRRGRLKRALRALDRHLDEEPTDAASRRLRAQCRLDEADYEAAEADARRALEDARRTTDRELRVACARLCAEIALLRGQGRAALEVLESERDGLAPAERPRDAWVYARALWLTGDVDGAMRVFGTGAGARSRGLGWEDLLAQARCQRRIGRLESASQTVVKADTAARKADGSEPDLLAELGRIYFEADREVEAAKRRSAADLYKQALEACPKHEGALLGLFELHRFNWRRTSRSATSVLDELLSVRPSSIDGLIAGASADFDDGQFLAVHRRLDVLRELAPMRREVRTIEAALAWVERRYEECEAILADLTSTHPGDGWPEAEVGRNLLELYRFAEGLPFLERGVRRSPDDHDIWTQLGRAYVNTGQDARAREAFERSAKVGGKRQDAWRDNMMLVLKRIDLDCVTEVFGDFTFVWRPDSAPVLSRYMVPFYQEHMDGLAERYRHTPEPTVVQVFRDHEDFSVRSTGFQGFPALGVCFGPVVTAVSPLSQLRRNFSWARTAFHEYAHVVHLGLSHNRCPRWVTEGLVTYEEVARNPAWTRNMRRDLVDAYANSDLILVRDMNRAFRGPRILFGYYQGGLVFQMLIEQHGFPPMVRLLEAFDRGLTQDQAFAEVLDTTPEEIDAAFERFVAAEVAGLAIEPRWSAHTQRRLSIGLGRTPPEDPEQLEAWADGWCTVAWGARQAGRKIDAQEALRMLSVSGLDPLRARFLRGELALSDGDPGEARRLWKAAIADGAEDFRVRVALGSMARSLGELDESEEHFLAAERAFPGFPDKEMAAELRLADLLGEQGRRDERMGAFQRWLAHNAGEYDLRRRVASWLFDSDRFEESLRYYREANEIDPFSRDLHREWGNALRNADQLEQALEEFRTALIVPADLDLDAEGPLDEAGQADLLALQAQVLWKLGRLEEALRVARQALGLDDECPLARDVLDALE